MEGNLFKAVSRDERQEESRIKWIKSGGRSSIVGPTGVGKTVIGLKCIKSLISKYPQATALIVVPTTALKDQWEAILDHEGLSFNCEVAVINTVIKNKYVVDLLVQDEVHRYSSETYLGIFNAVTYKFVLGLTATFERLDGKHVIMEKYCPICDEITLEEARQNGWVAEYKEYKVILEVDNIEEYKELNKEFQRHFEFFNYSWDLVMACLGPKGFQNRAKLRDELCPDGSESDRKKIFTEITIHAMACIRAVQARKAFINNHPKKLEITRRIIEARNNKKIITFSNNIKMAEAIGIGKVYSGKDSKKKGRITMEEFCTADSGVLNTIQKCNEGVNIPKLSVAIMLGIDSSKVRKTQKLGRTIRREGDKEAEIFTLVLDETQETKWAANSNVSSNVITIDEEGLNDVLMGKEPKPYRRKIKDFTFRF